MLAKLAPKRDCPISLSLEFEYSVEVDVVTGFVKGNVVNLAVVVDDSVVVLHELVLEVVDEELREEELCVELCVEETLAVEIDVADLSIGEIVEKLKEVGE